MYKYLFLLTAFLMFGCESDDDNCSTEDLSSLTIEKITLVDWSETKSNGDPWDSDGSGPDLHFRFLYITNGLLGRIESGYVSGALEVPPFNPIANPPYVVYGDGQESFEVDNPIDSNFFFFLDDIDNQSNFGNIIIPPDVIGRYNGPIIAECGATSDVITVTSDNGLFTLELEVSYPD